MKLLPALDPFSYGQAHSDAKCLCSWLCSTKVSEQRGHSWPLLRSSPASSSKTHNDQWTRSTTHWH